MTKIQMTEMENGRILDPRVSPEDDMWMNVERLRHTVGVAWLVCWGEGLRKRKGTEMIEIGFNVDITEGK